MAKKKKENDIVTDGSRALTKISYQRRRDGGHPCDPVCDLCSSVYSLAGKVCFK